MQRDLPVAFAPRCPEKHHAESGRFVPAHGNRKGRLEILYNLTDNAIRYGREGGYVHIRLGPDGFSVEDNGIGIDAAHQSRIFEQFYRVDQVRSAVGGTGLGLSIIQAIVQRYGGEIHLVSESGKGSRFIVQFGSPEGAQ